MDSPNHSLAPPWPPVDEDVRQALLAAYADGSWGKYDGPNSAALCEALRELTSAPHVNLCSSGTIAVELALRGLKIAAGDEVLLAAYDFPGNFRAIEAVGATPVLIDLEPDSWRMELADIPAAVGDKTRAILASHLHGDLLDMPQLCQIAREHNLSIVEDACQTPGAIVAGKAAGTWGDVGVFSFGGSKLLTAGRGGAVFTAREDIHQRIRIANDRGNLAYPLSELQAAVLVPQLRKLPDRNAVRRASVERLLRQLDRCPGLQPLQLVERSDSATTFYKVPFFLTTPPPASIPAEPWRDRWIAALQAAGLAMDAGFRGFVRRSAARCRQVGDLTNARRAAESTLLLHHPVLLQPPHVFDQVSEALAETCRALVVGK